MLLTLIGLLLGLPAGATIDAISTRLSLEWFEHPDDDDEPPPIPFALREGAPYRTALILALTVALLGLIWHLYGDRPWQAAVASGYTAVLITCTTTDLLAKRIANVVTYPAILFALLVGMLAPGADRIDVLLGALLGGGVMLAFALLPQSGLGDAKLGLFMGLALGARLTLPALLIMAVAGGVVACAILLGSRLRARRTPIPYGPYIALGMVLVMLLGGTAFHKL